jgi:signal transduction histidine kinase
MGEKEMSERPEETLTAIVALDADLVVPSLLHELKQPLMGADASVRLLERTLGATLAAEEEWHILRAQLDRIGEILLQYEGLLRPGDGDPLPFAVGPVVARAIALLAHRVRPLARRFDVVSAEGDRVGFGAPGALVHAATNVLANALDAVEDADEEARVQVRLLPGTLGGVEVRVSDEGTGISPQDQDRLFEPRFTTKAPGRGTGLGLHLARRLMTRQGGDVFLVGRRDPARLPWAVTEFCIAIPPPPGGAR